MNNKVWQTAGLMMALFGAAYVAEAQRPGGQRPNFEEMLKKYDADGDGQLSETERETMRSEMRQRGGQRGERGERPNFEEMLKKYDADGDGKLNETERETMRSEMRQRGGQGRRGPGGTAAMLKKYDTDGSGELSAAELEKLMEDQKSNPDAKAENGRPDRGQDRQRGPRMNREEAMAKYDTDGDGKLSETEREAMRNDMRKNRN
ncbi:hypothetical protein EGM51_14610 [Verrucomicrobia bacterium S94]|nr:hypothetical protein EGM51_14610 [Verrucomicrobia bacterium S94]